MTARKARLPRVDLTRLARIEQVKLHAGNHELEPGLEEADFTDLSFCVMEAVAYVAGEPWSDHPACTCPVLTALAVQMNDTRGPAERQELKPFIPRLVGTRGGEELEGRRVWMIVDWVLREQTPLWLEAAGLAELARDLRAGPEVRSPEDAAGYGGRGIRAALDDLAEYGAEGLHLEARQILADVTPSESLVATNALAATNVRAALRRVAQPDERRRLRLREEVTRTRAAEALDCIERLLASTRNAWWGIGTGVAARALGEAPAAATREARREVAVAALLRPAAAVGKAELALLDRLISIDEVAQAQASA